MSALALIMQKRGYSVSGSDQNTNARLEELKQAGITVYSQQEAGNIAKIRNGERIHPIIIVSTAIQSTNSELNAAKQANLEILHRSDLLSLLIKEQPTIAIAGTHGKTTTSTILTTLLAIANEDPTAIIGGLVPYYNSNSHIGTGRLLIAEADESDGSLIKFRPKIGVITNLELDHIDHYLDLNELIYTMKIFEDNCKQLIANYDCKTLRENLKAKRWWSIKTHNNVDFSAIPVKISGLHTIADFYENGNFIEQITIPIPGLHNLSNSIGAIAACRAEGMPFEKIKKGLSLLKAPKRRFEFRGIWKDRLIVDDYAHHPSEIRATVDLAKVIIETKESHFPGKAKRLIVVFQPHRYSRTKEFLKEFCESLKEADYILLAPIYPAGEKPIKGLSSHTLEDYIKNSPPSKPVKTANSLNMLVNLIKEKTKENDLILVLGAGNINIIWDKLNHVNS